MQHQINHRLDVGLELSEHRPVFLDHLVIGRLERGRLAQHVEALGVKKSRCHTAQGGWVASIQATDNLGGTFPWFARLALWPELMAPFLRLSIPYRLTGGI